VTGKVQAVELVVLLLAFVVAFGALREGFKSPYPIVCGSPGGLLGFVPGFRRIALNPGTSFSSSSSRSSLNFAAWVTSGRESPTHVQHPCSWAFGLVIFTVGRELAERAAHGLSRVRLGKSVLVLGAPQSRQRIALAATSMRETRRLPSRFTKPDEGEA